MSRLYMMYRGCDFSWSLALACIVCGVQNITDADTGKKKKF